MWEDEFVESQATMVELVETTYERDTEVIIIEMKREMERNMEVREIQIKKTGCRSCVWMVGILIVALVVYICLWK